MTTTTKTRPTEATSDDLDLFLAELERRAAGYPVDLTEPLATLRATLERLPAADSDRAISTLEQIETTVSRLGHLGAGSHVTALLAPRVATLRLFLRKAIEVPRAPSTAEQAAQRDVEKAEGDIAAATAALDDAHSQLAEAVETSDLEAVVRLRGVVEVTAPGQVDKARERLLDAHLAVATAQAKPLAEQAATAAAPLKAAQLTVDKARGRLEAAETVLQKVADDVATAEAHSDQIRAEVDRLTSERAAMVAEHRDAQRERTLRLAGLTPAQAATPEAAEPQPVSLIVTPPTAHFRR